MGMGDDGHTASIFPHTEAIHTLGRLVTANHVPQKDTWRITLTWPVINQASSVFFQIGGADKAQVVNEVLTGPQDPERLPSQLIWPSGGILFWSWIRLLLRFYPPPMGKAMGWSRGNDDLAGMWGGRRSTSHYMTLPMEN